MSTENKPTTGVGTGKPGEEKAEARPKTAGEAKKKPWSGLFKNGIKLDRNTLILIISSVVVVIALTVIVLVLVIGGRDMSGGGDTGEPGEGGQTVVPDTPPEDGGDEDGRTDVPPEETVDPEPDDGETPPPEDGGDDGDDGDGGDGDGGGEEYTGPVNPLTGLPTDEDLTGKRPWAVMLDNIKVAAPQTGLRAADLIYEFPVEGNITRLMAVYQDFKGVEIIGACRSSRPYFVDVALGLDAVYIHAGGSDAAYIRMKESGIQRIDGTNGSGETFYRDQWRRQNMGTTHSLMLNTTLLDDYVVRHRLDTAHREGYKCAFTFDDNVFRSGETAENITVYFASYREAKTTSFDYDGAGSYAVSQFGAAMKDMETDEQIKVKNVVVLYTSITAVPGDTEGRLQATLTGEGKGWYFVNGVAQPITWSRDADDPAAQFTFKLSDGSDLSFATGTTYFLFTRTNGIVEFS